MDNNGATFSSQTSPNTGNPLNPLPIPPLAAETPSTTTVEAIVSTPLEPVLTITEPAHDVALAAATTTTTGKNNEHQPKAGFQSNEHKLDIDDSDDHLDKSKSNFSMLTKSLLILAIVLFALFLCSVAFIIANLEKLNGKYDSRSLSRINPSLTYGVYHGSSEQNIASEYFNLTHPSNNGIIVVISRRGASIHDILIPYKDQNRVTQYRSIVVHGGEENHFGAVRFGFDDPQNPMDMVYQLPSNYPLLNAYKEEWTMSADETKPYRVRFIRDLIQIVYEFSSVNANELIMTTMVAPLSNEKLIIDPTNNIYFNLRGHGNLSTHYLNLSSSDPIDITNGQKMEQDRLIQSQQVDRLTNANNYFYKFDRAGIGKNYIATLSENEKRTRLHVFSDHAGVRIDPFGVGVNNQEINHATTTPDMRGVRISPRQSPVYEPSPIYGPTMVVYPSQAIHTTWWSFEYDN